MAHNGLEAGSNPQTKGNLGRVNFADINYVGLPVAAVFSLFKVCHQCATRQRMHKKRATFSRNPLITLVGGARFELATNGLKVRAIQHSFVLIYIRFY